METKANNKKQEQTLTQRIKSSTNKLLKGATPLLILGVAVGVCGYYYNLQPQHLEIPKQCQIVYSSSGKPISEQDANSFQEQNQKGQLEKLPEKYALECDCEDKFKKLVTYHDKKQDSYFILLHNRRFSTKYHDNNNDGTLDYVEKYGIQSSPSPQDIEKFKSIKELTPNIYK